MSANYLNKVQGALDDISQEIEKTRTHLTYLEGIAANLRKCLPHPALKPTTNTPTSLFSEAAAEKETDSHPMKVLGTNDVRMVRFRRKKSHATKIAQIIKRSNKRMKVKDVVNEYPKYGWELSSKNGYNQIYRTVTDRKDLFEYTEDKFILLKNQMQAASGEV